MAGCWAPYALPPPLSTLRVSHLGIVEYWLIHHLSFQGDSVNVAIPVYLCSVWYSSFDQAVKTVRGYGLWAQVAKCEIKSAFCLLPIHPDDFDPLSFSYLGHFYLEKSFPIGFCIS